MQKFIGMDNHVTNKVIAGIDVGSNAIRLCIKEYDHAGASRTIEKKRFPVRLGKSVFSTGELDEKSMSKTIETFIQIKGLMDANSVMYSRAVATSALREAKNRNSLIESIRNISGIDLEVISGIEEARLIYIAVKDKLVDEDDDWIIMDLGGGSVELSHASRTMLYTETKSYGVVRILEDLSNKNDKISYDLLDDYINNIRIDNYFSFVPHKRLIGTGGNIEEIAKIINGKSNGSDLLSIKIDDLASFVSYIKTLTQDEMITLYNIREDRADIILPAAMVYLTICKRLGDKEILVPCVGVRDGIVSDLYKQLTEGNEIDSSHPHLIEILEKLCEKYGCDLLHARHVNSLASSLFTSFKETLGLANEDYLYLEVAAMLHDIGQFISYERHHKHSLYIIQNIELPGFNKNDMLIIANVSRYHRRAQPKDEHTNFSQLCVSDQDKVKKLSSLLRLADAMDSEHLQRIDSFDVKIDDKSIELFVKCKQSNSEMIKIWKKGQMLQDLTGKKLIVKELTNDK